MEENNNGELSLYLSKVFAWMFIGLFVSGITAFVVSQNLDFIYTVFGSMYWLLFIVEIGLVIAIGKGIAHFNPIVTKLLFILYSFTTGLTLSSVFLIYEIASINQMFILTASIFGVMAFYGWKTKKDLTKFGSILIFALFGLLITALLNFLFNSTMLDLILTYVGLLIFLGLVIYDTQKIKKLYYNFEYDEKFKENAAIYGALELYLDFINILLRLLQLFGKSKD